MRSWPLFLPSFSLSLFSLRLLLLTHFGDTPVCENLFPPIFFLIYTASVWSRPPGPSLVRGVFSVLMQKINSLFIPFIIVKTKTVYYNTIGRRRLFTGFVSSWQVPPKALAPLFHFQAVMDV